jgi:hypothetical protein
MHHEIPKENYVKIFFMALGLVIILPFVFAYRTIKFLRE